MIKIFVKHLDRMDRKNKDFWQTQNILTGFAKVEHRASVLWL